MILPPKVVHTDIKRNNNFLTVIIIFTEQREGFLRVNG